MGDPAGIGGDLALRVWRDRGGLGPVPPFVVLDDARRLAALAATLGWPVPILRVTRPDEAPAAFGQGLPVLHRPLAAPAHAGRPDPVHGPAVRAAIDDAVALIRQGRVAGVVTNPLNKDVMQAAGFAFPGHTEYLAHLAGQGPATVAMMLACPGLRVVPVTIHVALAQVPRVLTTEAIVAAGRVTARALVRDFGLSTPRLAVAGLNPHAGENGRMGDEEARVIVPAVERLRAAGLAVFDPRPADTLFHAEARATYDAVLCMYHDQALIPLKTIDFAGGVNVTLGLPFVRTSPDHGTAFDIAGTGRADPTSLVAALRLAADMAAVRALPWEDRP
nr:4-hydroxythreonine-4-phosphate dehydrogenase PdxA [Roseospira visakhapatnamensis]